MFRSGYPFLSGASDLGEAISLETAARHFSKLASAFACSQRSLGTTSGLALCDASEVKESIVCGHHFLHHY